MFGLLFLSSASAARQGVKDRQVIEKLGERVQAALRIELEKNHALEERIRAKLDERIPVLRLLSAKHHEVLQKFKHRHPDLDFPALHKELFSDETRDGCAGSTVEEQPSPNHHQAPPPASHAVVPPPPYTQQ